MGGTDTIRGIAFQQAQALLDIVGMISDGVGAAVRVEGRDDVVDYEVLDRDGRRLAVRQAKTRQEPRAWGASELAELLRTWGKLDDAAEADFAFVTDASVNSTGQQLRELIQLARRGTNDETIKAAASKIGRSGIELPPTTVLRRVDIVTRAGTTEQVLERLELRVLHLLQRRRQATVEDATAAVNHLWRRLFAIGSQDDPSLRLVDRTEILSTLKLREEDLISNSPPPSKKAHQPVVIGEIPREPPAFQARLELMAELKRLASLGQVAVACAVSGGRGVGKTQLAAAYARQCADQGWALVAWITAESPDQILSGLEQLAQAVGVRPTDGDSIQAARAARSFLEQSDGRYLVIFDNATDPEVLTPWLPSRGNTQIVITSTRREFADLGTLVDVGLFERPEAIAYLRERTELDDTEGALALAEEVGFLPLALAQAAVVIRRERLSYATCVERLRRFPLERYLPKSVVAGYPKGTAEAILLSIEEIEKQDSEKLESQLLNILSALSPAGIARSLVHTLANSSLIRLVRVPDHSAFVAVKPTEEDVDAALGRLTEASVVNFSVDGNTITVHRMVSRVVRDRAIQNRELRSALQALCAGLTKVLIPIDHAWSQRDQGEHLTDQITALWATVSSPTVPKSAVADVIPAVFELRRWATYFLSNVGEIARVIRFAEEVLADSEQMFGPDDPNTLAARHDLAVAYGHAGRPDKAIPLHERSVVDAERILGTDHPNTMVGRSDLAGAYADAGQLGKAISLLKRTLADRERLQGPDHPDTLTACHAIAETYSQAGQLQDAISWFDRTLANRLRVLGPDDLDTLNTRSGLAGTYYRANRLSDAAPLLEQTLATSERLLGPNHPVTLSHRSKLASIYQDMNQVDKAIALFEQILAEFQQQLDSDHPYVLTIRNNLAGAYQTAGQMERATPLFEQTLADRQRVLGPDHPHTLLSKSNLAGVYIRTGELDRAIPLYQETLVDRQRVLGPDHPDTLASGDNLASAYLAAGQLARAIPLLQKALGDRYRVLGPNHPDTIVSLNKLAMAYQQVAAGPGVQST